MSVPQFCSPPGLSVREIAARVAGRLAELGCAELTLSHGLEPDQHLHAHGGVDLPGRLLSIVERSGSATINASCDANAIVIRLCEERAAWTGAAETAPEGWSRKAD